MALLTSFLLAFSLPALKSRMLRNKCEGLPQLVSSFCLCSVSYCSFSQALKWRWHAFSIEWVFQYHTGLRERICSVKVVMEKHGGEMLNRKLLVICHFPLHFWLQKHHASNCVYRIGKECNLHSLTSNHYILKKKCLWVHVKSSSY